MTREWDRLGLIKAGTRFNVPALHIGSWYDYDVAENLAEFTFFRTNADTAVPRDNQFIVISPSNHLPVGVFQGARRHR